jgi:hypothetical protein
MDNTMTRKGKVKNCQKRKGDYVYGGKRVRQVEGFAEKNTSKTDKNNNNNNNNKKDKNKK